MTENGQPPTSQVKQGKMVVAPGQPIRFEDVVAVDSPQVEAASVANTVGRTLAAYLKAARQLLEGKYANQKAFAPPHMTVPCSILVLRCTDGIFVRYDAAEDKMVTVRGAQVDQRLIEIAPGFSEQVIHCPDDPAAYVPAGGGPAIVMVQTDSTGARREVGRLHPMFFVTTKLPVDFRPPPPPARPPCLVSVTNNLILQMHGAVMPSDQPVKLTGPDVEHFIASSSVNLKVGWQAIEIYPPLGDEYWKPEPAALWAELDLLASIAQSNARISELNALDPRSATRKQYGEILEQFEALLTGPEEPVHQFLKSHPELLCPTADRFWSKLAFGNTVSDFVFREAYNDYLLVELEAPIRELFRKDGQQREELTHAINQITDWIQYIQDNKCLVEKELELVGISTNPRMLVVIGRSASLTEENRHKLATLQAQQNKLRILTYDDLLAAARSNLERILGPLTLRTQNVELFYF